MELTAPIVLKSKKKQVVYAPVLIPGEVDNIDNDVVTKGKVEDVAHRYMEEFRLIDVNHDFEPIDAVPVESWLTPEPMLNVKAIDGTIMDIPEGSWMMAVKVYDKDNWKAVENGELGGFSIMAVRGEDISTKEDVVAAVKSGNLGLEDVNVVTLEELGDSFVVPMVSLVSKGKVPKSKYIALKGEEPEQETVKVDKGMLDKILQALNLKQEKQDVAQKEGREFSEENRQKLLEVLEEAEKIENTIINLLGEDQSATESFVTRKGGGNEMSEEEKEEMEFETAMKSLEETLEGISTSLKGLEDINERLEKVEEKLEEEEVEEEEEEEVDEEVEALKGAVKELEDAVASLKGDIIPGSKAIKGQDADDEEEEVEEENTRGVKRDFRGINIEK